METDRVLEWILEVKSRKSANGFSWGMKGWEESRTNPLGTDGW